MHPAARQFVGVWNGEAIAHTGIIQFPLRAGWKRVHRLVVMPDYQGVGVGVKFINTVAGIIHGDGHKLNLTTTTPALVAALKKSEKWILGRRGAVKMTMHKMANMKHTSKASSENRPTFSFDYKP